MIGGIDLGGTKIEARLFDGAEARTVSVRRIPTPRDSYDALCNALIAQIGWLEAESGNTALPIGLSVPGIVDCVTGISVASNVPTTGHSLAGTLEGTKGRPFTIVNDSMAFTYSEARGGAAVGYPVVMGLILGSGVGGGLSNMAGITDRLTDALAANRLSQARLPDILRAQHGDASGARGAAMLATT